jgi:hypothetical protein
MRASNINSPVACSFPLTAGIIRACPILCGQTLVKIIIKAGVFS